MGDICEGFGLVDAGLMLGIVFGIRSGGEIAGWWTGVVMTPLRQLVTMIASFEEGVHTARLTGLHGHT